jgi:outer membrane biosynthesis protein TonB
MQRIASSVLFSSFCFWLLAGCAAHGSKSESAAAPSPVPVAATGAGATSVTNSAGHFAIKNLSGKDSPFSKFDAAILSSTLAKWREIQARRIVRPDRYGLVKVRFHLHPDGAVSDIMVLERFNKNYSRTR